MINIFFWWNTYLIEYVIVDNVTTIGNLRRIITTSLLHLKETSSLKGFMRTGSAKSTKALSDLRRQKIDSLMSESDAFGIQIEKAESELGASGKIRKHYSRIHIKTEYETIRKECDNTEKEIAKLDFKKISSIKSISEINFLRKIDNSNNSLKERQ